MHCNIVFVVRDFLLFTYSCRAITPCLFASEGRSNSGKSTLLNALLGFDASFAQKATVTSKPGETRAVRLYGLGGGRRETATAATLVSSSKSSVALAGNANKERDIALVLADMPGYGFAYMNDTVKMNLSRLIFDHLTGAFESRPLRRVLLLLDARHGLKSADRAFFQELGMGLQQQKQQQEMDGEGDKTIVPDDDDGFVVLRSGVGGGKQQLPWKLQVLRMIDRQCVY